MRLIQRYVGVLIIGVGYLFLDVDHPPLGVLIREFYSNLSIHFDDSNVQSVTSWIRGEEYVITSKVVASALHVPLVQQPIYPYTEVPLSMTLCLTSLVLPFSGVLILVSPLMSLLISTICFSRFLVILFGLSITCTPFLLSDVHFYILMSPMLL